MHNQSNQNIAFYVSIILYYAKVIQGPPESSLGKLRNDSRHTLKIPFRWHFRPRFVRRGQSNIVLEPFVNHLL